MRTLLVGMIFIGIGLLAPHGHAQFSGDITGQGISISLQPQFPNPGDTVVATIDDYAYGGGGGEIIWQRNGVELPESKNQRSITFTANTVGEPIDVQATLRFGNGQVFTAKQTVIPYFLDVIIEPYTYTPVFYNGRGMPTHGSTLFVTALIHDTEGPLPASDYSYTWQLNGTVLQGGPVRGGNKTKIIVPYGLSSVVTVSVSDPSGNTIARRLIEIPTAEVDLRFYEVSTLYGLTQKSIGRDLTFIGNSTTIRAVPYNLNLYTVDSNLFTEWSIDSKKQTSNAKDPFEINLRRGSGNSSQVSFKLRHTVELLQGDSSSFTVKF